MLRELAISAGENFHQFTGGSDEVVLLFQLAAENIVSCGLHIKTNRGLAMIKQAN